MNVSRIGKVITHKPVPTDAEIWAYEIEIFPGRGACRWNAVECAPQLGGIL
jgi:hypothetical protein